MSSKISVFATVSALFIILLVLEFQVVSVSGLYHRPPKLKSDCQTYLGNVNQQYTDTVNNDNSAIYIFSLGFAHLRDPNNTNIRVEVTVGMSTLEYPVIFAIGQQKYLTSIELPYSPYQNESVIYYDGARTLCVPTSYREDARNISVRVSTRSRVNITYAVRLSVSQDYIVPVNQEISLQVGPTSPILRRFLFNRESISSVKILVESKDLICTTVSIQPLSCPIFDQQNNIQFNGLWQTMTQLSAMTIEKNSQFYDGFFIVFVVHNSDEICHKSPESKSTWAAAYKSSLRKKTVRLQIRTDDKKSTGTFLVNLMIPVFVSIVTVMLTWILFRFRHSWLQHQGDQLDTEISTSFALQGNYRGNLGSIIRDRDDASGTTTPLNENDTTPNDREENNNRNNGASGNARALVNPQNSVVDGIGSMGNAVPPSTGKIRFIADIYIGDFTRNLRKPAFDRNSRHFCWSLLTVAIFYTIPVYQLLFQYLRGLYTTGQLDLCYYNYLCSHRVGYLLDFNHFFSNIGYVIFGISFILIVRRRDVNLKYRRYDDCLMEEPPSKRLPRPISSIIHLQKITEKKMNKCCCCFPIVEAKVGYGVAPHFGVFYALGLALIIEGLLSGAYHICPSASSFQFDTCFMYVISILVIVKVYQFRHPVSLAAHQTFLILAGLILVAVAGLLLEFGGSDSKMLRGFRITFTVFQFLVILTVSLYHYTMGYFREADNRISTEWKLIGRLKQVRKTAFRVDRLILPLLTLTICTAVVVYSEVFEELDFATYLLYTFVGLVLGFCLYYIGIMKPLHGEFKNGLWMQPAFYFLACGAVGGWAVYYFVMNPAQWEKSAAESRSENNLPCMTMFPFKDYGVHDAWHFLSAAALFFAFMGLLCVDDDLISIPESRIPVF